MDMLQDRCDGNRNIIHTAVAMCCPATNKENEADTLPMSFGSGIETPSHVLNPSDLLSSIAPRLGAGSEERLQSRGVSLRDMMRRVTSRAVSGLDVRDLRESDRDDPGGISVPTLNWPPDPPPLENIRTPGKRAYSIIIYLQLCKLRLNHRLLET